MQERKLLILLEAELEDRPTWRRHQDHLLQSVRSGKRLLLSSDIPATQTGLFSTRYIYICLHGLALLPPWNDLFTIDAGLIPSFVGPPVPGLFLKADAGGLSENRALPG